MIERFARAMEDDLPDFTLPYCRRVTIVWCTFVLLNAAIVLLLVRYAPPVWWTMYTGAIAYALIALLFASETCFRKWWFRYYGVGPLDRVFARVFPPEHTPNGRRSLAYGRRRRVE